MTDAMRGKYHLKGGFKQEFETAIERLAPLGGVVEAGTHDYEAFTYSVEGLRLIFYPHKTKSTGNRHIRVRSTGKVDKDILRKAIFALAENTCTFQYPADSELHNQAVYAAIVRERERNAL